MVKLYRNDDIQVAGRASAPFAVSRISITERE
jgi:hypothetical protein